MKTTTFFSLSLLISIHSLSFTMEQDFELPEESNFGFKTKVPLETVAQLHERIAGRPSYNPYVENQSIDEIQIYSYSGKLVETIKSEDQDIIWNVTTSPDHQYLAAFSGNSVHLWDAQTGKLIHKLDVNGNHNHYYDSFVGFSRDSKKLIFSGMSSLKSQTTVFDSSTERSQTYPFGYSFVDPEAQNALSVDIFSDKDETHATSFTVISNEELREFKLPNNAFNASRDVMKLAASDEDGNILIYDTVIGAVEKTLKYNQEVWCEQFSDDGQYLAVGYDDSTIQIWDLNKSEVVKTLPVGDKMYAVDIKWSADNTSVIAATQNNPGGNKVELVKAIAQREQMRRSEETPEFFGAVLEYDTGIEKKEEKTSGGWWFLRS